MKYNFWKGRGLSYYLVKNVSSVITIQTGKEALWYTHFCTLQYLISQLRLKSTEKLVPFNKTTEVPQIILKILPTYFLLYTI